jgi:hypothetical protein
MQKYLAMRAYIQVLPLPVGETTTVRLLLCEMHTPAMAD